MKNSRMLLVAALIMEVGQWRRTVSPWKGTTTHTGSVAHLRASHLSGEKLSAHGTPIKVAVGKKKEEVFLCSAL